MSVVIPPGFAEASIQMRNAADPDPWFVTFGVELTIDPGFAAATIHEAWMDSFGGNLSPTTNSDGVRLRIGQDGGDPLVYTQVFTGPGAQSSAKLPQNCALLVTKQTALGGRKGKGRFFVPNIVPEGECSETGILTNNIMPSFVSMSGTFLAGLSGGDVPMYLLHNEDFSDTEPPTEVLGLAPSNLLSTQRRRLR